MKPYALAAAILTTVSLMGPTCWAAATQDNPMYSQLPHRKPKSRTSLVIGGDKYLPQQRAVGFGQEQQDSLSLRMETKEPQYKVDWQTGSLVKVED